MSNKFKEILISSDTPKWHERLRDIHQAVRNAAYFDDDSEKNAQLDEIIQTVQKNKNSALIDYTKKFDKVTLTQETLKVNNKDLKKAHKEIDKDLLGSIRQAIKNVRKYQEKIFVGKTIPGKVKYTPVNRVGICIPGASAPLPSTVIMTVVPAQVAGVKEIAVVSPPRYKGSIHPVISAVCHELGITEVYRIGGAHAVAALAYGTQTITPVDKIVGPGNQWVQMAKKKVFGKVGIDSIAGPSEVLIIADDNANPAWVAADMLSQAEHDPGSASAMVFTDSQTLAEKILDELEKQVKQLDRSEAAVKCMTKFCTIIVFDDIENVIKQANYFAPEHLQIQCGDKSRKIAELIENAGAIFIGDHSPVAVGDYWAGPSHTLPTGSSAKFFSALSANDFVKATSIIEYDKNKLAKSAEDIIRLAMVEGLDAHAKSVKIRQEN